VRRTDPGDPKKCPVWQFHKIYSADEVKDWVCKGCCSAEIGCIDCKKSLIEAIIEEQALVREQVQEFVNNPNLVRTIVAEGCEAARNVAQDTIKEVREIIGLV